MELELITRQPAAAARRTPFFFAHGMFHGL